MQYVILNLKLKKIGYFHTFSVESIRLNVPFDHSI